MGGRGVARWACRAALVAVLVAQPHRATACSFSQPPSTIDPARRATDQLAPTLPAPTSVTVNRGVGPRGAAGCGQSTTSCDDLGSVQIGVAATDDQTPAARIGYRLRVVKGSAPRDLVPQQAIEAVSGVLFLAWLDGATDDQEGLDFTLEVVAVDGAGNESAPQSVRVQDGGGGCALTGRRPAGAPLALFAAGFIVLTARRRRR